MIVDVSAPLHDRLPGWPGQAAFGRRVDRSVDAGERSTLSTLTMSAHTGTHIDGPVHFLAGSGGVDGLSLEACIGPAWIADLSHLEGHITAASLASAAIPEGTERLLVKTRNSGWSSDSAFREDFAAYDASAASWCVERGMRLVANDYLSIEPFGSGPQGNPTHRTLLEAGVVVVEGIDLQDVAAGAWEVIALPLRVSGGDGAPARVVLRRP